MAGDEQQRKHEPPAGATTTATWNGSAASLEYAASANWLVLRKKEKPAAEIFSVSYVAQPADPARPVMFVFNGGPGASSAFLHVGAVGPQRVDFPADGSLPAMPPHLVQNDESWLAFADLVFVDPVGTGFSRVVDDDGKPDEAKGKGKDEKNGADETEYFGQKRDLESLCEFIGRWLSGNGRWGSPVFVAGESYGGYRVARLVKMLQEDSGIGLNGAILISPALEFSALTPSDYEVLGWVDLLPTMAAAAAHHGHPGAHARAASDRAGNGPRARLRHAPGEREVLSLHRARLELCGERCVRGIRLGDDDEAAGLLVETVDDAGAKLST